MNGLTVLGRTAGGQDDGVAILNDGLTGKILCVSGRPSWFNSDDAKKEEAQKVQRHERGKGGVTGRAGDAAAGEARGEQEARQKRQAQTQPGEAAGGCWSGITHSLRASGKSMAEPPGNKQEAVEPWRKCGGI